MTRGNTNPAVELREQIEAAGIELQYHGRRLLVSQAGRPNMAFQPSFNNPQRELATLKRIAQEFHVPIQA